jgi:hypothetical protein
MFFFSSMTDFNLIRCGFCSRFFNCHNYYLLALIYFLLKFKTFSSLKRQSKNRPFCV